MGTARHLLADAAVAGDRQRLAVEVGVARAAQEGPPPPVLTHLLVHAPQRHHPLQHRRQHVLGDADLVAEGVAHRRRRRHRVEHDLVRARARQLQQAQPRRLGEVRRPVHAHHGVRLGQRRHEGRPVGVVHHHDLPARRQAPPYRHQPVVVIDTFDQQLQGVTH